MATSVEKLCRTVNARSCLIPSAEKILNILSLLVEAELGDVTLNQILAQMEGERATLIRWISMFVGVEENKSYIVHLNKEA